MSDLPRQLADAIVGAAVRRYRPAYLRVDAGGAVLEAGGDLGAFGLEGTPAGAAADDVLPALAGLLGVESVDLPSVEVRPGRHADLHTLPDGDGAWVLLLDRTQEVAARRVAQQLSNEMSLLRDEMARGAHRREGRAVARRRVTVMTTVFGGLAEYAAGAPVEAAADAIGRYARAVARAVVDEAGIAGDLNGETTVAAFGLLPSTSDAAYLAVTAALRASDAVAELNRARSADGTPSFAAAIGVATGDVVVGTLRGGALTVDAVVGPPVEGSRRIAYGLGEAGVAVDAETREGCGELASRFEAEPRVRGADVVFALARGKASREGI